MRKVEFIKPTISMVGNDENLIMVSLQSRHLKGVMGIP